MADFEGQWPIAKYHFRVTIDGEQISFQEVSGLEASTDVIEYRHLVHARVQVCLFLSWQ